MKYCILLIYYHSINIVISSILVDRMEDLTSPESIRQNTKCDRRVSLYGFVRGIPMNKQSSVHIPGNLIE